MPPRLDLVSATRHALSLVAPPACPVCGRPADRRARSWLCAECRPSLRIRPVCRRCGRALADTPANRILSPPDCRACRPLRPAFDFAASVCGYQGTWRRAVLAFKAHPRAEVGPQLAGCLRRLLRRQTPDQTWDLVIPIPARQRPGSHPATVLAELAARRLGLPTLRALVYTRTTRPQRGLNRRERLRNLAGALRADPGRVRGLRVLLLDDVYTTGATVSEGARALKQAGAAAVGVLTLARGLDGGSARVLTP